MQEAIDALQPWFHNLHLPGGFQTVAQHPFGDFPRVKWEQFKNEIPEDLSGWTALDIGCNAGFYSFELAKRGADVMGIDLDPHYLKQAQWAAKQMGLADKVSFRQMQIYDLARMEQDFDIIIFMGVFYHLRYPALALDIVTQKLKKLMVFQTLTMPGENVVKPAADMSMDEREQMRQDGWPVMAFIQNRLEKDPTNWWAPNHACILALLETCGLEVVSNPGHEIYITQPNEELTAVAKGWNRSEFLSAIGRDWMQTLNLKVKH